MRRPPVLVLLAAAALAAPLADIRAQDRFAQVQIQTTKLTDGLHMLVGAGGNLVVSSGEDGTFLVDDQFAELSAKIQAAIAKITDDPVKYVFNTHWHPDHRGGNANFTQAGAIVVAHENVRKRLTGELFTENAKRRGVPAAKDVLPVVTFTDSVGFHLNGEHIRAIHVPPAHTDGDSLIHFEKANVVHMGDCYFNGLYPFIDLSSNGSLAGVIGAADIALGLADENTQIVPGHGPLATRKDLTAYRDMLRTLHDTVGKLIDEGKSRQEVIAAKPTAAWDAAWGGGFIRPEALAATAYDSIVKERAAQQQPADDGAK